MLGTLTCETFAQCMNQGFKIHAPSAVVEAELIEAKAVGAPCSEEGMRQPFCLVFRARGRELFEQGTFQVECEGLGKLDLFLVPIEPDDGGTRYEAVFG
ncbi:MAG: hypothetical protein OXU20_31300 [Myxococcales bacterium]|nr:hypothetical protein [Myxococcales bacterium]MDD9965236.1 hypothetical protein [Myxococcales bacterium]